MGYAHIENLYKCQDVLLFKECYALEKVHGTSAHIQWKSHPDAIIQDGQPQLTFFSGGEKHDRFVKLFDQDYLRAGFERIGQEDVTVYGEAHGGSQQGMSHVYGKELRFIVFDVKIGDCFLAVPQMDEIARGLNLEVVPWKRLPATVEALDKERDALSEVASRRGMGTHPREGIVIRPLIELRKNNGERIIAKHKGDDFAERTKPPKVDDPAKLEVLKEAEAIAEEWVTPTRLEHVVGRLRALRYDEHGNTKSEFVLDMTCTKDLINLMQEDVYREAKGEIVESDMAKGAIGRRTAKLLREKLQREIGK